LVILCLKSYDILDIIETITNIESPIMCCQNGLQTLHLLIDKIGPKRISYLVTGHGISKIKPGISEHKGKGFTYIGELSGTVSERIKQISNDLCSNGVECNIVTNIGEYVWLKTIINSAINPIAALAEVKNGELKRPELYEKIKEICEESEYIAVKKGIKLPLEPWKEINSIIDKTANNKCSMLQDLENNKQTEIDAINGELIRIAKELSINPIHNQQVFSEIEQLSK
jgi:2-dehydropantoate 2-reductase